MTSQLKLVGMLLVIAFLVYLLDLAVKRSKKRALEREIRDRNRVAPCGDVKEHFYWVDDGWPCQYCLAMRQSADQARREAAASRKELRRDRHLAKMIAQEMKK